MSTCTEYDMDISDSSIHTCNKDNSLFCYVCGKFESQKLRRLFSQYEDKYKSVFSLQVASCKGDTWVPSSICGKCRNILNRQSSNSSTKNSMKFPAVWKKPETQADCHICMVEFKGMFTSNHAVYKTTSSFTPPIYNDIDVISASHIEMNSTSNVIEDENQMDVDELTEDSNSTETESDSDSNSDNDDRFKGDRPIKPWDQKKLNDIVRDLGLAKDAAEYLASNLKNDRLLAKGTRVTIFRNREKDFLPFFKKEESLIYCTDIQGLINVLKPNTYKSEEWRLFIDSSTRSLKIVLLHNTNELASIPIGYSVNMNEEYQSLKLVLKKIKYTEHNWQICGDLKILTILLGQQSGFTRHPCFLCLWNSRDREKHYTNYKWTARASLFPGSENILNDPLVPPTKVLLPPLHIKLGLMKQFVKTLDKEGNIIFLFAIITVIVHSAIQSEREKCTYKID